MDNPQIVFNWIIGISGALGGWMLKIIWDSIVSLQNEIREVNKEMHQDFVRRDDFKDGMNEIKEMLGKIFDRLDNKADK